MFSLFSPHLYPTLIHFRCTKKKLLANSRVFQKKTMTVNNNFSVKKNIHSFQFKQQSRYQLVKLIIFFDRISLNSSSCCCCCCCCMVVGPSTFVHNSHFIIVKIDIFLVSFISLHLILVKVRHRRLRQLNTWHIQKFAATIPDRMSIQKTLLIVVVIIIIVTWWWWWAILSSGEKKMEREKKKFREWRIGRIPHLTMKV